MLSIAGVRRVAPVVVLAMLGCGGAGSSSSGQGTAAQSGQTPATIAPAVAQDIPGDMPRELVTAFSSNRPALFLHERADAPALGFLSDGVRVELAGPVQGDRVSVNVRGGLEVVGLHLAADRLAAYVQRAGRVRGTPTSLGPSQLVRVLGPADEPRRTRVETIVRLVGDAAPVGTWQGTYPTVGLGPAAPTDAASPAAGTPMRLPSGRAVSVYTQPGGQVVATLPAQSPGVIVSVVRDGPEWRGVRIGRGPYLVGWINAPLEAAPGAMPATPAALATSAGTSGVPRRIAAERGRRVYRVAAGTTVRFDGRVIARVTQPGWAAEMRRYDAQGEVDVFVAVDDQVAVRGLVAASALTAAQ